MTYETRQRLYAVLAASLERSGSLGLTKLHDLVQGLVVDLEGADHLRIISGAGPAPTARLASFINARAALASVSVVVSRASFVEVTTQDPIAEVAISDEARRLGLRRIHHVPERHCITYGY